MTQPQTESEARLTAEQAINATFSPHAPINQAALFRGRVDQVRETVDTVQSDGLHAVIYGERGVGKTSLANILNDFLGGLVSVSKVICSQNDSFPSVMRRALGSIQLTLTQPKLGLRPTAEPVVYNLLSTLPDSEVLAPDDIATLLSQIPLSLVLVFDEFDRLLPQNSAPFADLIKALSDRGAASTVVLVGVAEDVNHLLGTHASVVRNLRQIHLPRMSDDELAAILDEGLPRIGFSFAADEPRRRILSVSQGFPHYTHLLAQYGARAALDSGRSIITDSDVVAGMRRAVERGDQSNRELYYKATTGTRKANLWKEVVSACATAKTDDRGYFSIRDIGDRMSEIRGTVVSQQAMSYHLGKLTEQDRGPLLERIGPERRYRYRFVNALMRPFIIMQAMNDGLITP